MKIVKIKRKKEILYFPLSYPHEIVGQSFKYFITGEGYKKTKVFEILDEELPDNRNNTLSWLEIMYIHEKYGLSCSIIYAKSKCPACVATENTLYRYELFQKAKHLINRETDAEFFDMVQINCMLAKLDMYVIDLVSTDDELGKKDAKYKPKQALYHGKPCSINEYIKQKFGERYARIVDAMLDC